MNGRRGMRTEWVARHLPDEAPVPVSLNGSDPRRGERLRTDRQYDPQHWERVATARAEGNRRAAARGTEPFPAGTLLTTFLAQDDEPPAFRIAGLAPENGATVFTSQKKVGKTTTRNNVIRSLVDGDPFLGQYEAAVVSGGVGIIDTEMDPAMGRHWLRKQGIVNTDHVIVWHLRQHLGSLRFCDRWVRSAIARELRAAEISFVMLDCVREALEVNGLKEDNDGFGTLAFNWDLLCSEAEVPESMLYVHEGLDSGRVRGGTKLSDWATVEWHLELNKAGDWHSARKFSAYGRDVDVAEHLLEYDAENDHLTLSGASIPDRIAADRDDRAQLAEIANRGKIMRYVRAHPGQTTEAVRNGCGIGTGVAGKLVRSMVDDGQICRHPNPDGPGLLCYEAATCKEHKPKPW